MEQFQVEISARYGQHKVIDIESDNVFKDVAKIISEIDLADYPKGCTVKVYDEDLEHEDFWVVNKGNTKFVRYGNQYNKCFEDRIDYDIEPKYLTCLDEETNDYKYYLMNFNKSTSECQVQYGRIGQDAGTFSYENGAKKDGEYKYPAQMFWIKYYEKISKGYQDQTEDKDFDNSETHITEYKKIDEKEVSRVMEYLIKKQRDYVQKHFDMSVPASKKAIEKAEDYLEQLEKLANEKADREAIISVYKNLIVTLPRKIDDVYKYTRNFSFIEKADNYIGKVLEQEHDLLSNFIDVYNRDHASEKEVEEAIKNTVLEANGLTCIRPTYEEQWTVEDKLCGRTENGDGQIIDETYLCSRVLLVENKRTKEAYEKCKVNLGIEEKGCHLLFHGSRTENWWSIFKNGMSLNPNAIITGKMFGQGLYFAPLSRKSLGYTDFKGSYWSGGREKFGYLALFEVAMGKPYEVDHSIGSNFRFKDLKHGCHSTWAKAGTSLRNDECIVYREDQCNMKYLIEMDADRQPFKTFDQRKIRQMKCSSPYYSKKKDTIKVYCNLSRFADTKEKYITYDCQTDTLITPPDLKLSRAELEYLTDVFKSNFADSPSMFKEMLPELKKTDKIKEKLNDRN